MPSLRSPSKRAMHIGSCGLILLVLTSAQGGEVCKFGKGKMLPNCQITKLTSSGNIHCVVVCLLSRGLEFVLNNVQSRECDFSNKTVDSSSPGLNTDQNISSLAKSSVSSCRGHPVVENGKFNNVSQESPIGKKLPLVCDPGHLPQGEVVCQDNGTWSSPLCASVSSCSMVKQYQPTSEDGEYWLRLTNFNNYTTRFYCHKMSASVPEEFLTLPKTNYGVYPNACFLKKHVYVHPRRRHCRGKHGQIWFKKVKVNIYTMKVYEEDKTFAQIANNGKYLAYGHAIDCFTRHGNGRLGQGTRGRFTIDLRGTGWKVSEHQQWSKTGYEGVIEKIDKQVNEMLIQIRCGGWSGGCRPRGGLFLKPNP